MYAVIETGGKQYRVQKGDVLRVERLAGDSGDKVSFDRVLLVADGDKLSVGRPYVEGGSVEGTVRGQGRARKIEIIKFRRRKHHMKRQGHRQLFTEVEITGISAG